MEKRNSPKRKSELIGRRGSSITFMILVVGILFVGIFSAMLEVTHTMRTSARCQTILNTCTKGAAMMQDRTSASLPIDVSLASATFKGLLQKNMGMTFSETSAGSHLYKAQEGDTTVLAYFSVYNVRSEGSHQNCQVTLPIEMSGGAGTITKTFRVDRPTFIAFLQVQYPSLIARKTTVVAKWGASQANKT